MKKLLLLCALACGAFIAQAKVTLPNVLATNAVLQQNENVTLWGKGEPNAKLTVRPSWTKQKYMTQISAEGDWSVDVETISAGGPYSISFNDGEELVIENILLGEVWLCFGQSNMRMVMTGNGGQPVEDLMNTILQADSMLPVRYFRSEYQSSFEPMEQIPGKWGVNSSKNVRTFGATGYFFAKYLQSILKVPVGVVEIAWGGSRIESWMSADMMKKFDPEFKPLADTGEKLKTPNHVATQLFNGLLAPIKNLRFEGALWYQGEANIGNGDEYPALFKIFVESLRADHFDNGKFPFYYAQLAPYEKSSPYMRETMANMIDDVERTGMIVLSDVGEDLCIHPRQKKAVGERFAFWALGENYGYNVGYRAPEYNSMRQVAANNLYPKRVALSFKHAPLGLCLGDPEATRSYNFEVAGEDRVFYPATARIGWGKDHIEVWCEEVENIVAVRYGFKNYFKGDVYNSFGIPISSFRTDDWE